MTAFTYRQEILRKSIHLSSLWMPACVWFLPFKASLLLLSGAFLAVAAFELLRRSPYPLGQSLQNCFRLALRPQELSGPMRFSGAVYMLLAALLVTVIAPREIAATALLVLMISDALSALIGRRYGKHRIGSKSWEGSSMFLLSALYIVAFIAPYTPEPRAYLVSGCVACIASTLGELYAKTLRMDDNLLIPLLYALTQISILSILS